MAAQAPTPEGPVSKRRALALCASLWLIAATVLLYANSQLAGDLYWLLAGGRYIAEHGIKTGPNPFLTLSHGQVWYNQQWLSEWLFYQVQRLWGLGSLMLLYALSAAIGVLGLGWMCRHRDARWTIAGFAFFCAASLAVLQLRSAGFSYMAFGLMLTLVSAGARERRWWLLLPPLFVLWANLHGGFVAGVLFIELVAFGEALKLRHRRLPSLNIRRALPLAGVSVLCGVGILLTPLGPHMLNYMLDISSNAAMPVLTNEWKPTFLNPGALALFCLFGLFIWKLWRSAEGRRPTYVTFVIIGFMVFAATSARQVVWLGPLALWAVAEIAPENGFRLGKRVTVPLLLGAIALLGAWRIGVASAPNDPGLLIPAADYAVAHPPSHGRILTPTGTGSYLLWRAPNVAVLTDGRLEDYSANELLTSYALLAGEQSAAPYLGRWQITAVITRNRAAPKFFEARHFKLVAHIGEGYYLVADDALPRAKPRRHCSRCQRTRSRG